MKLSSIIVGAVMGTLIAGTASAQFIAPGTSPLNPPLPPPLPPPRIEVPAVPQMDAPPSQPSVAVSPRGSFSDRISGCLDEAAAAGLSPGARAAYSRSCANQD
jgi:hypothetical protein